MVLYNESVIQSLLLSITRDIPTIGGGSTVTAADKVSKSPSTPIPQGNSSIACFENHNVIHTCIIDVSITYNGYNIIIYFIHDYSISRSLQDLCTNDSLECTQ